MFKPVGIDFDLHLFKLTTRQIKLEQFCVHVRVLFLPVIVTIGTSQGRLLLPDFLF
jgi:hypothetical protein